MILSTTIPRMAAKRRIPNMLIETEQILRGHGRPTSI
tara:strand:- start:331 stop:441 length:111 start_codon:yes stop_codon:yes gene_type:complete